MTSTVLTVRRIDGELGLWIFRDPRLALEHLCDHVLTLPEARIWFLLLDRYGQIVKPEEGPLVDYARQLWSEKAPLNVQGFFEAYEEKIQEAVNEARRRGWLWQDSDHRWRGLNCFGIYVMWDDWAVLTGMIVALAGRLPGYRLTPDQRAATPLPRMNTRRWPARMSYVPSAGLPEPARGRLLHQCFIEGMFKLRQEHDYAQDQDGVQTPLPDEAYRSMPFQQWQTIRATSGSPQLKGFYQ